MYAVVLLSISQHTKFKVLSFSDSKDMIVGHYLKNWSRPWPRLLGVARYPKANIWYILPACKIWRLSL